ncbi:MAG: sn-glycerol-3-phosphate ABC transporter ATP-binding protein UgpC [Phycisphaerales bacterium]|nr:MAG: sn-glycerol-3-phosphate ABC transporter ATP-binding protein UgpC [Phycisphaerales bacterium]
MATVTLEQITKVYRTDREVLAVSNVSLDIADREFVVLVGPSGCGKSTTLRMIAGLEEVSQGTIRIGDRVVNDVPPKDRDIAMVFQNYALYPHMTVRNNMAFGLKMRKVPKAEIKEKVQKAARMLGIEHLLSRKPKQLSGGERQRVAVGRAIVRSPKAFLFDEPLSNLDARLRVQMRAELKKLHRDLQTTAIYVTHDQEEAMTLGDRIVVMKAGVVHQCDTPLEVYARPADRFVASFVGTPPMNFLDGRLRQIDGRVCFDEGSGVICLTEALSKRLAGRVGQPMVLGARPETLSLDGPGSSGSPGTGAQAPANRLPMRVMVVETLGREQDVYLLTHSGAQAVVRVPADIQVTEGANVQVCFDPDRVHLFEPGENGVNVSLDGQGARTSAA